MIEVVIMVIGWGDSGTPSRRRLGCFRTINMFVKLSAIIKELTAMHIKGHNYFRYYPCLAAISSVIAGPHFETNIT